MTVEVMDVSRDKETGEITQFLIIEDGGEPELKRGSPENLLLYDPAEELPFDNGMYEFLHGQQALQLSEEPEVLIAPTNDPKSYILRVNGNTVETTPNEAQDVLQGVLDVARGDGVEAIKSVYDEIMATQVRRHVINALESTFEEDDRIQSVANGWLVDDFYLVDWTASLYTKDDDPDEADYKRGGGGVTEVDDSYEFVQLRLRRDIEPVEVAVGGTTYRLSEREMLFLSKVKWLLNRRHYHPDEPFWRYVDERAAVDPETGEPEKTEKDDDEEPNLDKFSL